MSRRDFHILYVDAGSAQASVATELLNRTRKLLHVPGQEEAMAYLRGQDQRRPDLILLNLPSRDCPPLLAELKGDENLRRIPVVVMGQNRNREDVLRAYDCYANCYVTTPDSIEELKRVLESLEAFWFSIAKLPRS